MCRRLQNQEIWEVMRRRTQHLEFDIPDDDIRRQSPDDIKGAIEKQLEAMKGPCPECGRIIASHSGEELKKCSSKNRTRRLG
jgi:hypothetical protein